jgi:chemotaxis signal transduction protein
MSTTTSTSLTPATIVALTATVILEEALLDVRRWIGLRTMAVATKPRLGTTMQVVVITEDMVAMVALVVEQFTSAQNIPMTAPQSQ